MPSEVEFILFALKQAKEAENFGVTRNRCCRNLKMAIVHHWECHTLGLRRNGKKSSLPRSKEAIGKSNSEVIAEHAVPRAVVVNMLMDLESPTEKAVRSVLEKYVHIRLVTREEDEKLKKAKLVSQMPVGWDSKNIWARYEAVGIECSSTNDED